MARRSRVPATVWGKPAALVRDGVPPPPPSKGGGRKPARKPTQTDKIAIVNFAESRILPSEVVVPKPPKPSTWATPVRAARGREGRGAPYLPPEPTTWGITVTAPPSSRPKASLDTRYKWALGSFVDPADRLKVASSMSDRKKAAKLRAAAVSQQAAEANRPRPNRFDVLGRLGLPTPFDVGKEALNIGAGAQHALTDIASGRAEIGAAKSLGIILPAVGRGVAGVIQSLSPGRLSSGPGGPMVTGFTPAEQQQMGIVTPGQLKTAAIGTGKVLAGTPVSIAGMIAKPDKLATDVVGMMRGAGMLEGAGAVSIPDMVREFFDPGIKQSDRENSFRSILEGTKKYLSDNYGGDVTWREALVDKPWNEPLMHFVDAITLLAPTAKLAVAFRYFKAGYTWTDAQRLARDPMLLRTPEALEGKPAKPLTYKPRNLTVKQKEGRDFTVEAMPSKSPLGRAAGRGYDVGSKALEAVGGGKVPILRGVTQTGRGLRITNRGLRRATRRLHAQAAALWKDVSDYTGGDEGRGARLFFNAQKPADVLDEVWLKAIGDDAQQLLDEGMAKKGIREQTPLERRLQKQLDRFKAQATAASSDRWLTRVKDVHHEIERLNASRLAIEADLKQHRAHLAELEARTGGMTVRARTAEEAQVHLDELLLEHQNQVEEMARAKFGPIDKREVAQRNVARGKAKRANARANKSMGKRGMGTAKLHLEKTVKEERAAAIEREVENFIADNPDHPVAQRWNARSTEIDNLRRGLTPEPENLFGETPWTPDPKLLGTVETPTAAMSAEEAKALGEEIRFTRDSIRRQESMRKNTVEQASDLAPLDATEPIVAAMRTDLEQNIRALPKVTPKEADGMMRLFDGRAREWGYQLGRDPAEWFSDPDGFGLAEIRMIENHADLPEGALAQIRPVRNARMEAETDPHYAPMPRGGVKPLDEAATAAHIDKSIEQAGRMTSLDKDPAKLLQTFREAHRLAGVGVRFRKWYQTSARAILDHVGGDVEEADKLAQLFGIYSANRDVPANSVMALRAYDQARAGLKITEGSANQIRTATKVMAGVAWDGRKTNSFYSNMLKHIDPAKYKRDFGKREVTVDIWMMRMFGFTGKSPTVAQYNWIENQIRELARQLGWSPEEVQAATWVAMKSEVEKTSLETAAFDFGHGIATHRGQINFGATTEGIPSELRSQHLQDVLDVIAPEGRSRIHEIVGVPGSGSHLGPDVKTVGDEILRNPGAAHYIPLLRTKGPKGDYVISKAERQMAKEASAVHGIVLNQEAVAYGRIFQAKTIGDANAVKLVIPGGLDDTLAARIAEAVGKGTTVVHSHDGAWLVNLTRTENKAWLGEMEQALKSVNPTLEERATAVAYDGGIVKRSQYDDLLARLEQRRPGAGEAVRGLASDVERVNQRYVADPAGVAAESRAGRAAQASTQFLAQTREPPVAPGHVRLYRGEGEGHLSYEEQGVIPDEGTTHYFSPDREFAAAHDTGGGVWYVDVPRDVAREHAGDTGVSLPATIADRAQRIGAQWERRPLNLPRGTQLLQRASQIDPAVPEFAEAVDHLLRGEEPGNISAFIEAVLDRYDEQGLKIDPAAVAAADQAIEELGGGLFGNIVEQAVRDALREKNPHGLVPPDALAQVRRGDLNGAVQFLNTTDGQRILYLTKQADVSTLVHELFGHGVREIATHYPEEFAKVEAWIGRPLADWTVEDHERFARVTERYFASGVAPVPELVDTFADLKGWMRAVYGGMRNTSDVPRDVRVALDSYFGSYNDNNVFRVAAMTSRPAGRAARRAGTKDVEYQSTKTGILAQFSDEALAKLRAQNDARAFARSREGIEKKWERLNKNLREKHGGDVEALSEEEQAELYRTYERLMKIRYMEDLADIDRETGLRKRIKDVEAALAAPDGEAYDGALASMRALIDLREDMLRSVLGPQFDELYGNRVDLLADYMADKGFIPADFARGTAMYVPHRGIGARPRLLDRPGMPLTGNVVGETKKLAELGNRNELLRWTNGDLNADPMVVFHAWQDAQAFGFVYRLKELLWDVGRDLLPNEAIPDGAMLINKNGVPVPHLQRVATSPARTAEAQKALAALEGRDLDQMQNSLETYVNETLKPSEEVRTWLQSLPPKDKIAAYAQHRIVDRRVVEAMFRPLRGSTTSIGGTALDYANTIARWSLIYTNPAYVPINAIGNSFFVLGQQGPAALSGYIRAAKIAHQNKSLAIRIAGEAGETPSIAGISRGRARTNIERTIRDKEDRALSALTAFPDRYPRITAWIYEARRLGYDTPAKMEKLIDGGTDILEKHRELVAERADEIMVRFDRLSDTERAVFTRWLFIWPWIRGATAWPFYYAKEYPFATGVAATVGAQTEQYRKQVMGDVPVSYRDMFPIWGAGGYESVINTAPISVGSTAAQSIEAIRDNVLSLIGEHNIAQGTALTDFMMPAWQAVIEGASRRNLQTGQPMTLHDAIWSNLVNFAPQGGKIRNMIDPTASSGAYRNRTRRAILQRGGIWPPGIGRLEPTTVDVTKLQGWAQRGMSTTSQEKVQAEIDSLRKRVATTGAPPIQPYVIKGIQVRQWLQDQKDDEIKAMKKAGWHPSSPTQTEPVLSDSQEAWIAYGMYAKWYPGVLPPPPTSVPEYALADYTQRILYGPNTPLSQVSAYMSAIGQYEKAKKFSGG